MIDGKEEHLTYKIQQKIHFIAIFLDHKFFLTLFSFVPHSHPSMQIIKLP